MTLNGTDFYFKMLDDFAEMLGEYGEIMLKYMLPIILILGVSILVFIMKGCGRI